MTHPRHPHLASLVQVTRRVLVSAAVGAALAAAFGAGFLIVAAPLSVAAAAVLRRIEGTHKTSSKGELQ